MHNTLFLLNYNGMQSTAVEFSVGIILECSQQSSSHPMHLMYAAMNHHHFPTLCSLPLELVELIFFLNSPLSLASLLLTAFLFISSFSPR